MSALDGQAALITGSSRGIGRAIAIEFARQGAAVAVHGRDASAVAAVVSDVRDLGGPVTGVTGDVTRHTANSEPTRPQRPNPDETELLPESLALATCREYL